MSNKFLLTSFLLFISFITTYPSKIENTNFLDYCYSIEKIISRNSVEKSKNLLKDFMPYAKDFTSFSTSKTQGALVNKIIDEYKIANKSYILSIVPNEFYCLIGYWIEELSPGIFQSLIYEKSKQKIKQFKNTKKELDNFIKDINLEYKSTRREINDFF